MAGHPVRTAFATLAMLVVSATAAQPAAPLRYDLVFHMRGELLDHVEVEVRTRTGPDGLADFSMPAGQAMEVRADHAILDTSSPGHWILRAAPGTDVALTWRSPSAASSREPTPDLWRSVLVRADAVAAVSPVLLAIPSGPSTRRVDVHWSAPPGWAVSTSLVQGAQSLAQVQGGTFMAGRHLRIATKRVGDARIAVASLGSRRNVDAGADRIARAVGEAAMPFTRHDYTFNIVELDGTDAGMATTTLPYGGTAYLAAGAPDDAWLPWVMVAAALPASRAEAATAWYTQGFVAFRPLHSLLAHGLISAQVLARVLDQGMTNYGNSPFRRAPLRQVLEEYASSSDMQAMVAGRGALFAWRVDAHVREATGGKRSLEDALALMDHAMNDPGPALIAAVAAIGAGDIAPLYKRYIVDGDLLQLPRDTLGPCFTIGTVADWNGWQVQHVFAKPACPR
jgi:predicted metalloprotease with PDZ domain